MSYTKLITGLDVGTTKVCAVVAEINPEEQPNVIGVGISPCVGLRKGIVVDLESTTAAIRDAIDKAERMAGEVINSVVLGVTGEHIACLNSRSVVAINNPGSEIQGKDVDRLMDAAKIIVLPPEREILHTIPRWYSVDGQTGVRSPVGLHGNRLEMETHIVTGLSSFIQNVVKCVHMAGFSVEGTVLEPIAAGESVLSPAEKDLGVVLVDIGGGTTDVGIYIDGQIYYSGVVPVGGNHVTRDIAIGLRTDVEEAEQIKLAHGTAMIGEADQTNAFEVKGLGSGKARHLPVKILAEIIEPRMTELCFLVLEHINKAGCHERLPAGLVFTGGGSQIRGLPGLASIITNLPARVGCPKGLKGLIESVSGPAYSTAAGLIIFYSANQTYQPPGRDLESILAGVMNKVRELISKVSRQ